MPKILLFRPHPSMTGGVVNYYNAVLDKLSATVTIENFIVGRRPGFWGRAFLYPLQFLGDWLRLIRIAFNRTHDVYHFNPSLNRSAFLRDSVFILTLALFHQRRILIFFRGWEDDYFTKLTAGKLGNWYFRAVLNRADYILVLASTNRASLIGLGVDPANVEVTSTTFDGTYLNRDGTPHPASPIPEFLFMSRLVERKGVHELLDAAVLLLLDGLDFRLTIAGSGPAQKGIAEHLARTPLGERVSLPGYLQGRAKAETLRSADIFLLPTSHGEGCPNCLLEAMGAGLPVITTRVGGIPDVIQDGVNGILISEMSPHSIAAAMRLYIEDPELREETAERNLSKAWSRYESHVVADWLESVYIGMTARTDGAREPA